MLPRTSPTLLLLLLPAVAHAHPGGHAETGALLQGLIHPLTGTDHLIFMLGLGIYAGYFAERLRRWLGAAALLGLAAGSGPSIPGLPPVAIEAVVLASLGLMGLALLSRRAVPVLFALSAALALSYAHGLAHQEAGFSGLGQAGFVAGLLLTSGALIATGRLVSGKFRAPGWSHCRPDDQY